MRKERGAAVVVGAILFLGIFASHTYAAAVMKCPKSAERPATKDDTAVKNGRIKEGVCYDPGNQYIGETQEKAYKTLDGFPKAKGDCNTSSHDNIMGLNPSFAQCAVNFLEAYQKAYGDPVTINSAQRSMKDEVCVCEHGGIACGRLGQRKDLHKDPKDRPVGPHENGIALDVSPSSRNFERMQAFARRNPNLGVNFPLGMDDKNHLQATAKCNGADSGPSSFARGSADSSLAGNPPSSVQSQAPASTRSASGIQSPSSGQESGGGSPGNSPSSANTAGMPGGAGGGQSSQKDNDLLNQIFQMLGLQNQKSSQSTQNPQAASNIPTIPTVPTAPPAPTLNSSVTLADKDQPPTPADESGNGNSKVGEETGVSGKGDTSKVSNNPQVVGNNTVGESTFDTRGTVSASSESFGRITAAPEDNSVQASGEDEKPAPIVTAQLPPALPKSAVSTVKELPYLWGNINFDNQTRII